MNTYEIVSSLRTTFYMVVYTILLIVLFIAGKAATSLLAFLFPGTLSLWIDKNLWYVAGVLIATSVTVAIWDRINLHVEAGKWKITTNSLFDRDHWYVYGTGNHFINPFEFFFKEVSLFSFNTEEMELKASTRDDDMTVKFMLLIKAVNPVFILLNESDPQKAAKELAVASTEPYIEQFTVQCLSNDLVGYGTQLRNYVQTLLSQDTNLREQGLEVIVTIKKIDFSPEVSISRSQSKLAIAFRNAVDNLAGAPSVVINPNTNEVVRDRDGNPLMSPPDITREEAAAILLAQANKGKFDRSKDERIIRIEGDPEMLAKLKHTGILHGEAGEGTL